MAGCLQELTPKRGPSACVQLSHRKGFCCVQET